MRFLLICIVAVGAALLAGMISASGRPGLVAIFAGLICGLIVLASRYALLWFLIIGSVVVVGLAQLYLPGSRYMRYVMPLASVGLLLYWLLDVVTRRREAEPPGLPAPMPWAFAFAAIALISTVVNLSSPGVAVMGLKGYFQLWAFFLGLVFVRWRSDLIDTLPKGMFAIALLQLPFAMHQYFFLVPKRVGLGNGIVPVDVVAGTFGATLYGGGANAVLAAFLIIVVACLLGIWKNGALSTGKAALLSLLLLAPVFVNEAKISAIYLPLVFIVIFAKEIAARPGKFFLAGVAFSGLLVALLTALTLSQASGKLESWQDLVNFTIERQTAGISERKGQYSELSRLTALTFWASEHVTANPAHTLIGHGPGASRVQEGGLDLATTLAETRYGGLQIGYTALSAMLWDVGLLGTAAVLGMFYAAFRTAGQLGRHFRQSHPWRAGLFDGLQAGIAVLTLSLAHKDFFVVNLPYQALVYLMIGFIAFTKLAVEREMREQCTGKAGGADERGVHRQSPGGATGLAAG